MWGLRRGHVARAVVGSFGLAATILLLSLAGGAESKKPMPGSAWVEAERLRVRLEATPATTRTKADYDPVLEAFRLIYHRNPSDLHAPASIYAVAELLTDEGRSLREPSWFRAAISQYEFLRTQYPASSLRTAALLAEAQVAQNDLHDTKAAKERYGLLLKEAPKSGQAEEARAALGEMARPGGKQAASEQASPVVSAAVVPQVEAAPVAPPASPSPAGTAAKSGGLALVTGIRHWSTPSYTRVVIDLGDNVTYEAARVPKPDRIYFDLHGTQLVPQLAARSFTVTDDGFLKRIRAAQFRNQMTRVVLDIGDVTEYSAFLLPNPYRLIIDIHGKTKAGGKRVALSALPPEATVMRPGSTASVPETTAVKQKSVKEVASLSTQTDRVEATSQPTSQPIAAVVERQPALPKQNTSEKQAKATTKLKTKPADGIAVGDAVPARAAVPTADGETSLVRALGLKIGRIVIDAGHGGHDSGTLGVDGIEEKDVVLDVALRLGKLLHDRLGAEIVYTRSDDTFVALEDRTAIANKAQADLFLSIHANSSPDESARGVETYYLNFTTDQGALAVASRENAVSDQSIHQLGDLVKKIALKNKIEESREFAGDVEQGLYGGLQAGNAGLKNRGVKKAPFVVLIGANMPSVLAEISFVTNPRDARQLQRPEYRQRVAESLYKGVAKYEAGLGASRLPVERAAGSVPGQAVVP